MKSGIHPEYVETTVTCTCGNSFTTRSTAKNGVIHADICSSCHPFYTGKQKILDTGGRVARFERRFGKKAARQQVAGHSAARPLARSRRAGRAPLSGQRRFSSPDRPPVRAGAPDCPRMTKHRR